MLQAAVDSLREALGAVAVYGFSVARDGQLHGLVASPVGRPRPANLGPDEHPESVSLLCRGEAGVLESWREPGDDDAKAIFVPWWSEEGPVGAALVILDDAPDPMVLRMAVAHGTAVGSRIAAERRLDSGLKHLDVLRRQNAIYKSAVEQTPDALFEVDLDGSVLRWNAAAESLYGWSAREAVGSMLPSLGPEWRLFTRERVRDIASGGAPVRQDTVQRSRDGSVFHARLLLLPMFDESGVVTSVIGMVRPLGVSPQDSMRTAGSPGLTGAVLREVTGPLTALVGYTDLLGRPGLAEDAEQRDRVIRGIRRRCDALTRVLEDLMTLSRVGELALKPEVVDLAEMCRTLVVHASDEHGAGGQISAEVTGEGHAMADRRSAEASVKGLLRSLSQQVSPGASMDVSIESSGHTTSVRIEITEPDRESAADLSERIEAMIDEASDSDSSLGVRVARMVAEAHGGALTVKPNATPRPSFTLELPAHLPVNPAEEERWNSTPM